MSGDGCATLHDVAPDAALAAVEQHRGLLLLDLDETLYFRNSTEDFLDSVQPGTVALLLLRMLDLIKPWRWTGGEATRDVWRVRVILAAFPWARRTWAARVGALAESHGNHGLLDALRSRTTAPVIATIGFGPIVEPLLAAMGLGDSRIISARLSTFSDRRRGKLGLVLDALGADAVRGSMVVTDSVDDLPLLNACGYPIRTLWPGARYVPALGRIYVPGQYLTQIKRPGERYIVRGILQEDYAFWVLSSIALAAVPALHALGLLFLLISFWSVYECGYVDNDRIAAAYEEKPKLTEAFSKRVVATPAVQPWLWSLASGAIAIALLRWPGAMTPIDGLSWIAVLLATHLWFRLYNRLDKSSRVWMYAGLQLARSAAFVALVPISVVGATAIGAHVLARWMPYYLYRFGGNDWPDVPLYLVRLLFLLILSAVSIASQGIAPFWNLTALGLLAWTLLRARHELKSVFQSAQRLDRLTQEDPT